MIACCAFSIAAGMMPLPDDISERVLMGWEIGYIEAGRVRKEKGGYMGGKGAHSFVVGDQKS